MFFAGSPSKGAPQPEAIAVKGPQAAALLGVSNDFFKRNISQHIGVIRVASVRLYRLEDLHRWADEQVQPPIA